MTAEERHKLLPALNVAINGTEAEVVAAGGRVVVLKNSKPGSSVSIIFVGEGA